ncbi:MAG TPA: phytanoyl-CoA dioxygenase family protein [Thermoanaerobaculia bacterium]|nr:phytanoyl-CoA dioxygenase family protein [Thermoanaerobaculia bacterium]
MPTHPFAETGFRIVLDVFSGDECDRLLESLAESSLVRSRAGARHVLSNPVVREAALDSRLIGLASEALAAPAIPYRATLFDKSPGANWLVAWHQDRTLPIKERFEGEGWGPWSIKAGILHAQAPAEALGRVVALRVHLDPSTAENGPLRVIPGSHRLGVLRVAAVANLVEQSTPVTCLVPRGGILVMRPLLVHSSSKATSDQPRRVLHIEYTSSLTLGPGQEIATI